ncbi:MAG: glycosyltransferase family 39 protein [Aggregatilineales bacterium]
MQKTTAKGFHSCRPYTAILIVLLLAAALRILNAGHFPIWTDEGWGTWAASDHNLNTILGIVAADRHPPLYFLALSAWWTLAGDSRIALRFLSIAAGLLIVALVYRVGKEWFGHSTALYAALIAAILPIAIYYSQELRDYGWLTLTTLTMTWLFLRYLQRPRIGILIAYAVSVAIMLYTLYLGAFMLIIHAGIGLIAWRGTSRQKFALIGGWILAAILYLPWLGALVGQVRILSTGIDGFPTTPGGTLAVIQALFGVQFALTGGAYLIGVWRIGTQPAQSMRWLAQATIVWCSAGLLALMMLGNLRIGLLSARTLVFLTPFLALIAGYGLSLIPRPANRVLMAALSGSLIVAPGVIQPRLDYPAAAKAVAADYSPGDLIVLETGWDDNAFRYELMLALGDSAMPQIIRTLPWVDNRDPNRPVLPQIEPLIRVNQRVWVVNWLQPSQAIPFLDGGGDGFVRALSHQTDVGKQYAQLYADRTVQAVLFEHPRTGQIAQFGSTFALHDALIPTQIAPGEALHIDLWWSALQTPPRDYSVSVFILDSSGVVRAQQDQPPGDQPTSQWTANTLKFDRHTLTLPANLPPGKYQIGADVYWYGDRERLPVSGLNNTISYAILGTFQVGEQSNQRPVLLDQPNRFF